MPSFDYITSADFRTSLESDYADMRKCAEAGAWKSAQVLAGSIVEALLVDYLVSTSHPVRGAKDPLRMDLAETIAACKAESVLSDRSADLCSVIRSYRNLIHPGRMVRLGEQPPSKTTCDIATALIDLIVEEISKTRRAAVGLTAEQILSKVVRDSGCLTILKHLLVEVSETQRERLLVSLLPLAYIEHLAKEEPFDETADRLADAYRITLESVTAPTKERVALEFVRVLKQEDGALVDTYRKAFFRASDLESLPLSSRPLVREHLLGAVASTHSLDSLRMLDGIGPHLEGEDCVKWTDTCVRTLISSTVKDGVKKKCRELFIETAFFTSRDFDTQLLKRLDDWVNHFAKPGSELSAKVVKELREEIVSLGTP